MYMEAADDVVLKNNNLGITCDIKFHPRAWTSNWYTNRIDAMIKDAEGKEKIQIEGWYSSEITATNLESGEKWIVFKAPPAGVEDLFNNCGMNAWALKLNQVTDDLRAKLPPTDSRLRNDVQLFEKNEIETSD